MSDDTPSLPPASPWWAKLLVSDIKYAATWLSVQLPVAFSAIAELYAQYPDKVQAYIPAQWRTQIVAGMFLLIALGRIIK